MIQYAIFCGVITGDELERTAFCEILEPEEIKVDHQWGMFREPEMVIVITPETKVDEVTQLFKKDIPDLVHEFKERIQSKRKLPDTISNIKRDRDWYWKHKAGLSYQKIWKQSY